MFFFLLKECPSGYFGMNCIEKCSEHCINKATCDHVSGMCPSGCQDGFVGTHCNKCKIMFQYFTFLSVLQTPLTKRDNVIPV